MITNVIVLDDKIVGYKIKTGEISYSTCKDGLMSKPIFDSLIKDGYKYFGNQIFETPEGNPIDELTQINYNTLSADERSEFDIADNLYKDEDVLEYISKKPPKDAPKWKEPLTYMLNTREELIEFLKDCAKLPEDNPASYMPLNAFTNPEALMSEQEYLSANGLKLRNLIKSREKYSFTRFINLIDNLGVDETSTPLDIIDKYYSWGISGLRADIYSKRILSSNRITRKDGVNIKTTASVIQQVLVDKYGETVVPLDKDFAPLKDEKAMESFLSSITNPNEVVLTPYTKPVEMQSIEYVFETFRVEINPDSIKIITKGYTDTQSTISVTYPSDEYLPAELWNFKNPIVADTIIHNLKVQSLRNYLIDKLRINCDTSSYKMYRSLGLSDYCAIRKIYSKYKKTFLNGKGDISKEASEKLSPKELDIIKYGNMFFKDVFTNEDNEQDDFKDLIDRIRSGDINVDNIASGIIADASTSDTKLYNYINAALKELHMSYEQIHEMISKLDPIHDENMILKFTNGKYYCNLPVIKRVATKNGFDKDYENAMSNMAKTAMDWLYITEIFSEPGAKPNRHVGVMAYCWRRSDNKETARIEEYISEHLLNNSDEKHLKSDIATLIFQSYVLNTNRCIVRGKVITLSNSLKQDIASCIEEVYEGTTEISNNMVSYSGQAKFFICNAKVTPYWVIPLGKPIPVSSAYYKWNFGKNLSNTANYNKLKGIHLINKDCYSLNYMFRSCKEGIPTRLVKNTDKQPGDFDYYGDKYLNFQNKYVGKPPHPYDELYPVTASDNIYSDEVRNENLYLAAKYENKASNVKNICDIDTTGEVYDILHSCDIVEDNKYIKKFNGFTDRDLLAIDDFKTLKDIFTAKIGDIPLQIYIDDTLIFRDGTKIKYYEIENLDRSKYMIRQINGNLYIVYNSIGYTYRVSI